MKSPKRPEHLTRYARENRKRMTPAEKALWGRLRDSPGGIRFRRQHPVGGFILDFACTSARLGVELDGESHEGKLESDAVRDSKLKLMQWEIVRLPNAQVLDAPGETAEWILIECQRRIQN